MSIDAEASRERILHASASIFPVAVIDVAIEVRAWAQAFADHYPRLYDPVDLMGLCAVASTALFIRLRELGEDDCVLVDAWGEEFDEGHVFVLCRGHVIDLTATQFDREEICIRPWSKALAQEHRYWSIMHTFDDVEAFDEHLESWPEEQRLLGPRGALELAQDAGLAPPVTGQIRSTLPRHL